MTAPAAQPEFDLAKAEAFAGRLILAKLSRLETEKRVYILRSRSEL